MNKPIDPSNLYGKDSQVTSLVKSNVQSVFSNFNDHLSPPLHMYPVKQCHSNAHRKSSACYCSTVQLKNPVNPHIVLKKLKWQHKKWSENLIEKTQKLNKNNIKLKV